LRGVHGASRPLETFPKSAGNYRESKQRLELTAIARQIGDARVYSGHHPRRTSKTSAQHRALATFLTVGRRALTEHEIWAAVEVWIQTIWNKCVVKIRSVMPNTHRRRHETVELRRVGVGGVYMNS